MSLSVQADSKNRTLEVEVSGKLTKEDYQQFVPAIEALIDSCGKIRVLFDMRHFHGWEISALWEDVKVDIKHFDDIEKLAMVGDRNWQKWMSSLCKPFTTADIRYFDKDDWQEARQWLHGGDSQTT